MNTLKNIKEYIKKLLPIIWVVYVVIRYHLYGIEPTNYEIFLSVLLFIDVGTDRIINNLNNKNK